MTHTTSWQQLHQLKTDTHTPAAEGFWRAVRFMPDRVAGEVFNIGVLFEQTDGAHHYKLIDNAKVFSYVFGKSGEANINYLLGVLQKHFDQGRFAVSPSANIHFSEPLYASGGSVGAVLDDVFDTLVSLKAYAEQDGDTLEDTANLNTDKLRKNIGKHIKAKIPSLYREVYHEDPLRCERDGLVFDLDLPLHGYKMLHSTKRQDFAGSIVSAAQTSKLWRTINVETKGFMPIRDACQVLDASTKFGLYIYRAPDGGKFTDAVQREIDNEIDHSVYILERLKKREGYDIDIEVECSEDKLTDKALELIT